MRIFAGEWVARLLTTLGMKEGEAIESRMVSRRIEAAQKKVEEQHFDSRKNLLEYDEVMDHQRKRVYGFRQNILDGGNCKLLILDMIDKQIAAARRCACSIGYYGPASFAEFAANRLGVEFEPSDFKNSDFEQAGQDGQGPRQPERSPHAVQDGYGREPAAERGRGRMEVAGDRRADEPNATGPQD